MGYDLHAVGTLPVIATDEPPTTYLNVTIDWMAELRPMMRATGMLADVAPPPTVDRSEFGVTGEVDRHNPTNDPKIQAYLDMEDARLAAEVDQPGIPAYKLMSTDGWLVTPREIASALRMLLYELPWSNHGS